MRWHSGSITVAAMVLIIAGGWGMTLHEAHSGAAAPTAGVPAIDSPLSPPQAASSPAPPSGTITGYGATEANWQALHQGDGRYILASPENGRVVRYSLQFAPGTTIDAARRAALAEFPPDARVVRFATKNACAQMEIESATLAPLIGAARPGQVAGRVFAEFDSVLANGESTFKSGAVSEVFFVPGDPGPAYAC